MKRANTRNALLCLQLKHTKADHCYNSRVFVKLSELKTYGNKPVSCSVTLATKIQSLTPRVEREVELLFKSYCSLEWVLRLRPVLGRAPRWVTRSLETPALTQRN